jgi:acyl-CoA thioester hydrolase
VGEPLTYRDRVRPEWIDYNGHLSEPYYVLVFGNATTAIMAAAGLDARYRAETGASLYTVEAHVRYLREVAPEAELTVRTSVLAVESKKVRLWHELSVGGEVAATEELLCLHVSGGRAAPMPEAVADNFRTYLAPLPDHAGRAIT